MDELTDRQTEVLEFIEDFIDEHRYPPTVREICEGLGYRSPSTVHEHLMSLRRKGWLEVEAGKPRAMRITEPKWS